MPSLVYCVGICTLGWLFIKTSRFFYYHFSPTQHSLAHYSSGGNYAVVTGATDGIGLGFAEELAHRGFNVILLARNKVKLEDVRARLIRENPKADVVTLSGDALIMSPEDIDAVVAKISHLPISILVNNMGGVPICAPYFRFLQGYTSKETDDVINLNARFPAHFTRLMLRVLGSRQSVVLNISSGAQLGAPWLAMYSGSKGLVTALSKGIAREMRAQKGSVDVISVNVGDVKTKSNNTALGWNVPSARHFAKVALDRVGAAVTLGFTEMTPYLAHDILISTLAALPEPAQSLALINAIGKKKQAVDKSE